MTNLLIETLSALNDAGHTAAEVLWVGAQSFGWFSWDEFAQVAAKTDYNSGYGAQKIATDLVVAGDGWWLARFEYDGSEEWCYYTYPARPEQRKQPCAIKCTSDLVGWADLNEICSSCDE